MSSSDDESPRAGYRPNDDPSKGQLDNKDLPALFWDTMPEGAEQTDDMAAIQAIIDESTPEERAANFKDQGNKALKTGLQARKKFYLREAVDQYTQGIELRPKDLALAAQLLGNRAHVQNLLGNHGKALADAGAALRADPGGASAAKNCFRAAKACAGLRRFDQAEEWCVRGLELEPEDAQLSALALDARAKGREQAELEEAERARRERSRAPSVALARAMLARGWRIGRPQFAVDGRKPSFDDVEEGDGTGGAAPADLRAPADRGIVTPALIFYPEASFRQDVVEAWHEDDPVSAHLDVMFGPEAPPLDWDTDGEYSRDRLRLYYLSNAATPLEEEALAECLYGGWPEGLEEKQPERYGPNAARWVPVDESLTLNDLLRSPGLVVPGIPVFFALSAGSRYERQFLEGDLPLLR